MINPFPVAERGSFFCDRFFVITFRQAIAPPLVLDSSVGALA
ncbi:MULTISPECIES: hypothetical protein [Nostoc cyanobionts]|nr:MULTISPECIES: hypothetical protein [unclassified Nostoc]